MIHAGGQNVSCNNTHGLPCAFHVTLRLSNASARKLGVGAMLADRSFSTTTKSVFYNMVFGSWRWRPSATLRAALKRASSVTLVYTASYRVGGGAARKMPVGTFVLRREQHGVFPPSLTTNPTHPGVVGPGNHTAADTDEPA